MYCIGDKVRVSLGFSSSHARPLHKEQYNGKVVTIDEVKASRHGQTYKIKEDNGAFIWGRRELKQLDNIRVGDKVAILKPSNDWEAPYEPIGTVGVVNYVDEIEVEVGFDNHYDYFLLEDVQLLY